MNGKRFATITILVSLFWTVLFIGVRGVFSAEIAAIDIHGEETRDGPNPTTLPLTNSRGAAIDCNLHPYSVNDTTTLNEAITCFNDATVAGTYTISFTDNISLTAATTTISNTVAGIDLLIAGNDFALDGQNSVRGLTIAANTNVAIKNLTVRNGNQINGGGIRNNGTLTISNSTFSGNSADSSGVGGGGGIRNSGTLIISNSTFSGNSADNSQFGGGGGIFNSGGTLTISHSTISGNSADNNIVRGGGGGGIITFGGTLTISNSTVSDNSADNSSGGGIYNAGGPLTISNSTLYDNRGGGIVYSQGTITLTHVTLDGNWGRGIVEVHQTANATVTLQNSIVSNSLNGAGTASAANCVDANNNNITANSGNIATDATCDSATVVADVLLAPPADNGSSVVAGNIPTMTVQTLALQFGSPAIDAVITPTISTDQRGVARPFGPRHDVGAYEFTDADCPTSPWLVDDTATLNTAIGCYNATSVAGTHLISFTDNISLTAATTTISNTIAGIDLQIAGNDFALDGQGSVRGLTIAADTNVAIENLTVRNGNQRDGGGILNDNGTLTISNSTISGNSAELSGGGIRNRGTLTVSNSTISGNSAILQVAGGIFNEQGVLMVSNSTISENSANIDAHGGGIFNLATATVSNSTISGNSAPLGGGGINNTGTLTLTNTIIANSVSTDCRNSGVIIQTHNLIEDGSCDPDLSGDPLLGLLQDNGGASATHELLPFSPALNAGDNATCLATDQRGVARPQGAACDIGAYEAEPPICTNPANVSDEGELNDAIACFNGATVAGSYTISITDNISLTAATTTISNTVAGTDLLIAGNDFALDGQNSERGFTIDTATHVTIDGLTIMNGNASNLLCPDTNRCGGGILNRGVLTLTNGAIRSSSAAFGGGMYNVDSSPTVSNITFSGNSAIGDGGGMYNDSSNPTVNNVTFSGNSADDYGGGMYNVSSNPTVNNVTFSGNSASITRGAGGGMYNVDSNPTISNVTFSGNSAFLIGGGMYNRSDSNPTVSNVTFSGNSAASGGGMFNFDSSPTIVNTIFWNNAATSNGGTNTVRASIFNDNSSPTISYSIVANSGGSSSWDSAAGVDGGNNLDVAPQFVADVDPMTAPTTAGDLRLQLASPAIDAGNNLSVTLTTDLDGNPRIRDGNGDGVETVDMGAFENAPFACTSAVYPVSTTSLLNEAIACFNAATVAGTYTISFTYNISLTAATTTIDNATANIDLLIAGNDFALDGQDSERGFAIAADTHVTIDGLTVQNGLSDVGGGVYNQGVLTISNTTIHSNTAVSNGGGVFNDGSLTIHASEITENGSNTAAGIRNVNLLVMTDSTVAGNIADNNGGGIVNANSGTLIVKNSTLSGNSAANIGGGINNNGVLTVTNSTWSDNSATTGGGLRNAPNGTLDITNSIIANSASGGDCVNDGTLNTNSNNLIADGSCTPALSGDPLLGPLQDNGGPTQTHALLVNSPARDSGDDITCEATDQRGTARPQDGNGDSVATCDMGAYEADGIATIAYNISDASVVEGDSGTVDLTFTITRSGSAVNGSVVVSTTDGTAEDGLDYVGITETVAFAIGVTSQTVTVTVNGDSDIEPDETLTATLSAVVNGVISDGTGIGTIENDDDLAPAVVDHRPISDAIDIPLTASVVVTFSEPVSVTSPITLNCDGNARSVTQTMPDAATVALTPDQPLPAGELCVVTVPFDAVEDDDMIDPPDNLAATYVFSFTTTIADSPPSGSLRIEAFTYQADPNDSVPGGTLDGYILLKNVGNAPLNVQGFMVGDEETSGGDEGMYVLPDHELAAGETLIIAEDADHYAYADTPDYSFAANSVGVPVLQPATRWSNGPVDLDNDSDEVILLNNDFLLEDGVCWGIEDELCVVDNSARVQTRLLDDGRLADNPAIAGYQRVETQDTNLQADWLPDQTAVGLKSQQVARLSAVWPLVIALFALTYLQWQRATARAVKVQGVC